MMSKSLLRWRGKNPGGHFSLLSNVCCGLSYLFLGKPIYHLSFISSHSIDHPKQSSPGSLGHQVHSSTQWYSTFPHFLFALLKIPAVVYGQNFSSFPNSVIYFPIICNCSFLESLALDQKYLSNLTQAKWIEEKERELQCNKKKLYTSFFQIQTIYNLSSLYSKTPKLGQAYATERWIKKNFTILHLVWGRRSGGCDGRSGSAAVVIIKWRDKLF